MDGSTSSSSSSRRPSPIVYTPKVEVVIFKAAKGRLFLHRPKLEKPPKPDQVFLKPELEPLAQPVWVRKYATWTDLMT
jgi:hypothetical protein